MRRSINIILTALIFLTQAYSALQAEPIPDAAPDAMGVGGTSFLGESFQADPATGAATMSVGIMVPPGRKNMQPQLALSYSSNNSNGICGMGWAIPITSIRRSTKNGIPKYDNTDTMVFISSGASAELVFAENNEYKAKIESDFMKYVYNRPSLSWTVYAKTGTKYYFGRTYASRQEDNGNIFGWYLDRVEDVYGNYITYIYEKPSDGQIYLKEIRYTGGDGLAADKKILFNYSQDRDDKIYSFRSGWEIATTWRLSSIYVKLNQNTVWRYELAYSYSGDTGRSLLQSVTAFDKDGNSLPAKTFTYQKLE